MSHEVLVILLGIASSTTLIISALSTHKTRLIIFNILTSVLLIVQFGLTGALVGLGACIVSILRSSTVLASTKWSWLNHWSLIPFFIVAQATMFYFMNDWSDVEFYNFVPVIGSMLSVVALYFTNLIYTKSLYMVSGGLWLFYEFFVGSYGHMIGETANIVANGVALVLLVKAARKGTEVIEPTEELVKAITTSIPVITTGIPLVKDKVITAMTGQIPVIRQSSVSTNTLPIPTNK
jgi:hypothetical protein